MVKEVIKEVPVEVIKEVIKEVVKEVPVEKIVTREVEKVLTSPARVLYSKKAPNSGLIRPNFGLILACPIPNFDLISHTQQSHALSDRRRRR